MSDKVQKINTALNYKSDMLESISNLGYLPIDTEESVNLKQSKRIPIQELSALGTGFEPVKNIFKKVTHKGKGKSGLYKVIVPKGKKMAEIDNKNTYIGSVLTKSGAVGGGQARLKPATLPINPAMMFMAVALSGINEKLSSIQDTQEEILNFLVQKEKSELKGDLKFLTDVTKNFKYNWDNEQYKNNHHIKVLDIKQTSEAKIDFFREQIQEIINQKSLFQYNKQVEKQTENIQSILKDYQLSVYLYAFSSFLDVMLLENYNENFLSGIVDKIKEYSYSYRELYTECYNTIKNNIESSLENKLTDGFSAITSKTSDFVSKLSFLKKTKIDETLSNTADKVDDYSLNYLSTIMDPLVERQSSHVRPFVDNINEINKIYNQQMEVYFDEDNVYFETVG